MGVDIAQAFDEFVEAGDGFVQTGVGDKGDDAQLQCGEGGVVVAEVHFFKGKRPHCLI